jgi:hypothetical protein
VRRLALSAVLCALLLAPVAPARADWIADADGAIVYEDNLTRATSLADRRGGIALASALTVGRHFQLTGGTSLAATADFKGSLYPEFDRLSNLSSTATVGFRHKLGLGAFAPWLRLFVTGGALDYGDDVRDGAVVDIGVQVGKRLTDRIDVEGGYTHESIDAGNGVFNADSQTFSLKGGLGLPGALHLTLGYAARLGDLVIHRAPAPGAGPTPHTRLVHTFDTPLVAARITATTHLFSAGLGYTLTPHAALNAGYEYSISFGPLFNYPNHLARASFAYSF